MRDTRKRTLINLMDTTVLLVQKEDPRLDPLVQYLSENLDKRLTLDRAAEIVGLERTYFSKLFHVTTGYTFSAWNRAVRIKKASALLCRRGKSIRWIASSVGYRDLTTFARAFKNCMGVSPTTYRSRYRKRERLRRAPDI